MNKKIILNINDSEVESIRTNDDSIEFKLIYGSLIIIDKDVIEKGLAIFNANKELAEDLLKIQNV